MKYQKLLRLTRQAVDTYQMIDEGDHIAVGISGGKDSLTLLCALYGLKRFYPKSFDLTAITVNLGFQNLDLLENKLDTYKYSESGLEFVSSMELERDCEYLSGDDSGMLYLSPEIYHLM